MSDTILQLLNNATLNFTLTDSSEPIVTPSVQLNADSIRLKTIIENVLPAADIHPLSADFSKRLPDCVYEIHGSTTKQWLHATTGYESVFLLKFRGKSYSALTQLVDNFSALIDAEAGMEITDMSARWNDQIKVNQLTLEIIINTPVGYNNDASVIIIKRGCKAEANELQNCLKQRVNCKYNFVIQAANSTKLSQIRAELMTALLGKEQGSHYSLIEYDGDTPFESVGGLQSWVATYRDFHIIHN